MDRFDVRPRSTMPFSITSVACAACAAARRRRHELRLRRVSTITMPSLGSPPWLVGVVRWSRAVFFICLAFRGSDQCPRPYIYRNFSISTPAVATSLIP